MKPIKFREQNVVYAENQPEYEALPVFRNKSEEGEVVSCWKLTFIERIKIMFTGKLWVEILTFNDNLQPMYFSVTKSKIIQEKKR